MPHDDDGLTEPAPQEVEAGTPEHLRNTLAEGCSALSEFFTELACYFDPSLVIDGDGGEAEGGDAGPPGRERRSGGPWGGMFK